MSRSLRIEFPGAFYHITSRGNERGNIFKSDTDRKAFLSYLESSTVRYGAVIHAYCLMSNHYHLIVETPEGNLSRIMHHINGAYTIYYNIKRNRAGHLFQGRFKAILVEADSYATELSRYIHLNPVRADMVSHPEEYRFSSFRAYAGIDTRPDWLTTGFILGYFDAREDSAKLKYKTFVEEAIGSEDPSPLDETVASIILGSEQFIDKISRQLSDTKSPDPELPAIGRLTNRPDPVAIRRAVEAIIADDPALARKVTMHLCRKYSGTKLKDLGAFFEVSYAGVVMGSKRLLIQAGEDRRLMGKIEKAEGEVLRLLNVKT